MKLHPRQIEAVIALPGPERYEHFIKQAADRKEVWGLYLDGWALASTDDERPVFPVWPAEEYAALCATVVVPPGNEAFVEQIAAAKFTLRPDALAIKPRPPSVETFEKKRSFTDGERTVELHSIGPTSHVRDVVVFYFPKEKLLFQGDMFSPLDVGGIPPVIEINRELVEKVEEPKLDVETLVTVHSGAVAWKDFRQAVADAARPAGTGLLVVAYMGESRVALVDGANHRPDA